MYAQVIPHDQRADNRNSLARTVLLGQNEDNQISGLDKEVTNLFEMQQEGVFSLIKLRILQLVFDAKEDENRRRVGYIFSILRRVNKWKDQQLLNALNALLLIQRPLLFIEGKSHYETYTEVDQDNHVLYFTEIGYGYFEKMITNFRYCQETFFSVKWREDLVPYVIDNTFFERVGTVRKCLRELMRQDLEEINKLKSWYENENICIDTCTKLISNRILYNLAGTAFRMISRRTINHQEKEELREWRSLIAIGLNEETDNFKLGKLYNDYRGLIGDEPSAGPVVND